jgi:hypothetical protein
METAVSGSALDLHFCIYDSPTLWSVPLLKGLRQEFVDVRAEDFEILQILLNDLTEFFLGHLGIEVMRKLSRLEWNSS